MRPLNSSIRTCWPRPARPAASRKAAPPSARILRKSRSPSFPVKKRTSPPSRMPEARIRYLKSSTPLISTTTKVPRRGIPNSAIEDDVEQPQVGHHVQLALHVFAAHLFGAVFDFHHKLLC